MPLRFGKAIALKQGPVCWDEKYLQKRNGCFYTKYRLALRLREIARVLDAHASAPDFTLLELGCADGRLLEGLRRLYPDARLRGIEPSPVLSRELREPSIQLIQGTVEDFAWQGEHPDFIVMAAVIEHLADPAAAFEKVRRIMGRESMLILTYPNPVWDRVNNVVVDTGHVQSFTRRRMEKLLERSGFEICAFKGFMLNPFFNMPAWMRHIEDFASACGLGFLMFNRVVAARVRR